MRSGERPSTWGTWREAMRLVGSRAMLRRTLVIALVVGTILSVINQAHVVAAGQSDAATWLRVAANYVVPFIVSNAGVLSATRVGPDRMRHEPTDSTREPSG